MYACGGWEVESSSKRVRVDGVIASGAREDNPLLPVWMDSAICRAASIDPQKRYPALSDFITHLKQPNGDISTQAESSLLDRNSSGVWMLASFLLLVVNLILLVMLFTGN